MPTEAEILDALRRVEDPELHRSIVELDMVRGIRIDADRVGVTVALTGSGTRRPTWPSTWESLAPAGTLCCPRSLLLWFEPFCKASVRATPQIVE